MAADFDKSKEQATDDERRAVKAPQILRKPKDGARSQTPLFLQRMAMTSPATEPDGANFDGGPTGTAKAGGDSGEQLGSGLGLVVEDSVAQVLSGQMRKSEFLERLREAVTAEATDALAGTVWSAVGCPWIDHWFAYYASVDAQRMERAVRKYAPSAAGAEAADELIPILSGRVRRAIEVWSVTGESGDVPADVSAGDAAELPGENGNLLMKGEGGSSVSADPTAMQSELGSGASLDGGVRSQMESAYGEDFSDVRVHADATGAELSSGVDARAFTVGQHIAFGSGEYQPGTPIGDALIAHELAHVSQQRSGAISAMPAQSGGVEHGGLEEDADEAAVGAVVSLWGGARNGLASLSKRSMPSLKSGLRLQRCGPMPAPKTGKLLEDFAAKFPDAAVLIRKSPAAVKFVTEAEAAGARFGGYAEDGPDHDTWPYTRNQFVYVPKAHTDTTTQMRDFLFELNNAMRKPTYDKLEAEAKKGSTGTLTAKQFARQIVEQEVEGMLVMGKTWVDMKKDFGGGKELNKYDKDFFITEYDDFKAGRRTKDKIVDDTLKIVYLEGVDAGKTVEQHYIDEYNKKSPGK